MNKANGITAENLLATLPQALREDESVYALACATAQVLAERPAEIDGLRIYPRIDELPEDLLDILAYDFKVDWYNYNYPLSAKREVFKSSFIVHRRMGTRSAVEIALSSIYPGTILEEWFEYGGEPYHFRIILDVTNQLVAISHSDLVWAVEFYKSLRSHLEDNAIAYRSRAGFLIQSKCGYVTYSVRLCGTYPEQARIGAILSNGILVETDAGGTGYGAPKSKSVVTGVFPYVTTQGSIEASAIDAKAAARAVVYEATRSANAVAGVYPVNTISGSMETAAVDVGVSGAGAAYAAMQSGSYPEMATQGVIESGVVSAQADGDGQAFSARLCGSVLNIM